MYTYIYIRVFDSTTWPLLLEANPKLQINETPIDLDKISENIFPNLSTNCQTICIEIYPE